MRISVKNSDPGYFPGSYLCTVYLAGVKLDDCVTADEEQGLAICYDMSEEGKRLASLNSEFPLIERRGEVRIITRDENGVCALCGVGAATMHKDDCPRAVNPAVGGCIESVEGEGDGDVLNVSIAPSRAMGGFAPIRLAGDGVRVDKVMIGDQDVTHLVDGEEVAPPGYVAVRIKASDPCYACDRIDGHDADCPMAHIERMMDGQAALERGEGVGLTIRRVTDDPDSVTIPLSFERLTTEERGLPATFIAQEEIKAGDLVEVDLTTGKLRRARVTGYQATQIIVDDPHAPEPSKPAPAEPIHRAISAMQKPGRANDL